MQTKKSAGVLVYRKNKKNKEIEVLLVHPGGPYWEKKDVGSWQIPKGEINKNESILDAAIREFEEETGLKIYNKKELKFLCKIKNKIGKIVFVYYIEKNFGDKIIPKSIKFEIEWPPKSGNKILIPEIDKIQYFPIEIAKIKILSYQKIAIKKLLETILK